MKRLIIITLFISFGWADLSAQDQTFVQKFDPELYVHWFYIKAETKIDKVLKTPVYVVRTLSQTPKSGKLSLFQKDVYRCLKGGQQIAVGPFTEYKDAQRALAMYDLARYTQATWEAEIQSFQDTSGIDEYNYFTIEYRLTERTHKYVLKRTAAAVATGTLREFREALWEGLVQKKLFIGPFTMYEEAEESKRLYRLEEEE
ncbi:MAG: hypothetical protein U0W24_05635 [Bacteroidales bacterium]